MLVIVFTCMLVYTEVVEKPGVKLIRFVLEEFVSVCKCSAAARAYTSTTKESYKPQSLAEPLQGAKDSVYEPSV